VSRTALLTERTAQLLCVDINEGLWREVHSGYTEKPWPSWFLVLTKTLWCFR